MRAYWSRYRSVVGSLAGIVLLAILAAGTWVIEAQRNPSLARGSSFLSWSAPAGERPATTDTIVDGLKGAVLPNGRLVTPAGTEVNVQAPKPFGLALSPDGSMLATLNSGAAPFSLTLISQLHNATPAAKRIDVNASFMGVTFSPDSKLEYLSGGENGYVWIGDAVAGKVIGSVNLNGPAHPLDRPLDVVATRNSVSRAPFPATWCSARMGAISTLWTKPVFKSM
jgi:hypothetical protein